MAARITYFLLLWTFTLYVTESTWRISKDNVCYHVQRQTVYKTRMRIGPCGHVEIGFQMTIGSNSRPTAALIQKTNNCYRPERYPTVRHVRVPVCCPGWAANGSGYCTRPVPHKRTCRNGATVVKRNDKTTCNCLAGFAGVFCEIDLSKFCINGGSFVKSKKFGKCACMPGFSGRHCERELCQHGGKFVIGQPKVPCACRDPFAGKFCQRDASRYCMNRGTFIRKGSFGSCKCPPGFKGKRCGKPFCQHPCINGGACRSVYGTSQCICPFGFTGKQCEQAQCQFPCQNGGVCVPDLFGNKCRCPKGFDGPFCQAAIKAGECPQEMIYGYEGPCRDSCRYDVDCAGIRKCCDTGCGNTCRLPSNSSCLFRDLEIEVGATFHIDPCTRCVCNNPSSQDGLECTPIPCPPVTNCLRPMVAPGSCCPVCTDHLFQNSKHYMTTAVPTPPRLPTRNHLTPFPVPANMLNAVQPPVLMGRTMPPMHYPAMARLSLASFPRAAMIDPRRLSSLPPMLQRALMSRMAAMQTSAHDMMTSMRPDQGQTREMMTSMMQGRNMMPPTNPGMGFTNKMMNVARHMMTSMRPGMSRPRHGMFPMRQGLTPSRNMMSTPVWPNKKAKVPGSSRRTHGPMAVKPGPKFTNCPTGVVEIAVTRDSLMAALTTNLVAHDCEGRVVPVRISTTVLRWRPDMRPYPVTAGAMDRWGNAVTCKFLVRVRDPLPPLFTFCPNDIIVHDVEADITWQPPTAVDNIGLTGPPTCDHAPHGRFPIGDSTVTCRAHDIEGKTATCQFIVRVLKKVSPTVVPTKIDPSVLKSELIPDVNHLREHPDQVAIDDGIQISGSPASIALYVMVLLLLSAFALLLACCCLKRRRVHRVMTVTPVAATAMDKEALAAKAKEEEANGVSNEIYTIAGALPPAYEELFRSLGMISEVSSPKHKEAVAEVATSEADNEPTAEADEGPYENLRRNSSTSESERYTALKKYAKDDSHNISQPEGAAGTLPGDCYLTPIDVALSSMYASVKRKHEAKE